MGWVYLLAAIILPAAFMLWQPRKPLVERERKVRLAGSVAVVWLMTIVATLPPPSQAGEDVQQQERDFTPNRGNPTDARPTGERAGEEKRSRANAPVPPPATPFDEPGTRPAPTRPAAPPAKASPPNTPGMKDVMIDNISTPEGYTGWALTLGWVPGLMYAGLLSLARKSMEQPAVQVIDEPFDPFR